ncbi:MAG: hypothetical protein LBR78_00065 [Holosporales bacterium]|jgi:hypothetical protein|nr:hypothetical protein [Holosporales bacterium]
MIIGKIKAVSLMVIASTILQCQEGYTARPTARDETRQKIDGILQTICGHLSTTTGIPLVDRLSEISPWMKAEVGEEWVNILMELLAAANKKLITTKQAADGFALRIRQDAQDEDSRRRLIQIARACGMEPEIRKLVTLVGRAGTAHAMLRTVLNDRELNVVPHADLEEAVGAVATHIKNGSEGPLASLTREQSAYMEMPTSISVSAIRDADGQITSVQYEGPAGRTMLNVSITKLVAYIERYVIGTTNTPDEVADGYIQTLLEEILRHVASVESNHELGAGRRTEALIDRVMTELGMANATGRVGNQIEFIRTQLRLTDRQVQYVDEIYRRLRTGEELRRRYIELDGITAPLWVRVGGDDAVPLTPGTGRDGDIRVPAELVMERALRFLDGRPTCLTRIDDLAKNGLMAKGGEEYLRRLAVRKARDMGIREGDPAEEVVHECMRMLVELFNTNVNAPQYPVQERRDEEDDEQWTRRALIYEAIRALCINQDLDVAQAIAAAARAVPCLYDEVTDVSPEMMQEVQDELARAQARLLTSPEGSIEYSILAIRANEAGRRYESEDVAIVLTYDVNGATTTEERIDEGQTKLIRTTPVKLVPVFRADVIGDGDCGVYSMGLDDRRMYNRIARRIARMREAPSAAQIRGEQMISRIPGAADSWLVLGWGSLQSSEVTPHLAPEGGERRRQRVAQSFTNEQLKDSVVGRSINDMGGCNEATCVAILLATAASIRATDDPIIARMEDDEEEIIYSDREQQISRLTVLRAMQTRAAKAIGEAPGAALAMATEFNRAAVIDKLDQLPREYHEMAGALLNVINAGDMYRQYDAIGMYLCAAVGKDGRAIGRTKIGARQRMTELRDAINALGKEGAQPADHRVMMARVVNWAKWGLKILKAQTILNNTVIGTQARERLEEVAQSNGGGNGSDFWAPTHATGAVLVQYVEDSMRGVYSNPYGVLTPFDNGPIVRQIITVGNTPDSEDLVDQMQMNHYTPFYMDNPVDAAWTFRHSQKKQELEQEILESSVARFRPPASTAADAWEQATISYAKMLSSTIMPRGKNVPRTIASLNRWLQHNKKHEEKVGRAPYVEDIKPVNEYLAAAALSAKACVDRYTTTLSKHPLASTEVPDLLVNLLALHSQRCMAVLSLGIVLNRGSERWDGGTVVSTMKMVQALYPKGTDEDDLSQAWGVYNDTVDGEMTRDEAKTHRWALKVVAEKLSEPVQKLALMMLDGLSVTEIGDQAGLVDATVQSMEDEDDDKMSLARLVAEPVRKMAQDIAQRCAALGQ